MGMALNRAAFMRKARRFVASFIPFVLAVSTLSAISIIISPPANALSNSDCTPTVSSVTASAVASGNDCVITFSSGSGTWTIPAGITSIKVLVVGGGGGGGADAGGGGGGGAIYVGTVNLGADTSRAFSVTVGSGGSPARHSNGSAGSNGSASTFTFTDQSSQTLAIRANGGGVGSFSGASSAGAAGAGGSTPTVTDGSATASVTNVVSSAGGAGGAGIAYNSTNSANAGTGGTNSLSDFSGSFGGGGGGGATQNGATSPGRPGGSGVNGGGNGSGGYDGTNATVFATVGATNSGGGGGAGSAYGSTNLLTISGESYYNRDGKSGGSGVVIVRFTVPTLTTPSTPDLDAASDTGISQTDNYTNDTTPTFTGTATAGSTIQLQIGSGSPIVYTNTGSTCQTNSSGAWTCTTGTLGTFLLSNSFRAVSTFFGTSTTSSALVATILSSSFSEPSSITRTNGSGTLGVGETATISFATGRGIYGFTVDDLTVSGGTISNFVEVNVRSFTATFTPTANASGTASISVGANKVTDQAGNSHTGSATFTIAYNTFPACSPSSTSSGGFTILTFTSTSTCNWNVPTGVTAADVMVVGGGGGGAGTYSTGPGGSGGGGGGGGAYLANAVPLTPSATLQIKAGSGGTGGITTSSRPGSEGTPGGDSSFGTLTAGGGGGGGCATTTSNNVVCTNSSMAGRVGTAGGSGGGATPPWNAFNWGAAGTGSPVTIGGTTFTAQTGYIGAIYSASANSNAGGAGSGGGARSAATTSAVGAGLITDIAGGSAVEYGRGGRGSNQSGTTFNATTSGYGNGGDGAVVASGAGAAGAAGAQGVVIVKYLNAPSITLSTSTITSTIGSAVSSFQWNACI
jgi:hypothetical protein